MRKFALPSALLLALAVPASAETIVVRPPVRVVRVIPAPPREVIVTAPAPAPVLVIRPPVIQLGSPCIVALLGVCVKL